MRKVLRSLIVCWLVFLCAGVTSKAVAQSQDSAVKLHWLKNQVPEVPTGVSWGMPFPKGQLEKGASFKLKTANGHELPVQSWPTAYWPDGSLKWIGLATIADSTTKAPLRLSVVDQKQEKEIFSSSLTVQRINGTIRIDTGVMTAYLPERGNTLIDSLLVNGRKV